MAADRVIFHIDCNGFYAAVECLDNPSLCSVPMAVAGDPEARSGIILAKNELAKAYGIQTAETVYQAKHKCPNLVLVPPRSARYREVSSRVKALFAEYTDQVESFGLDEAWLDVTGSLRYFRATPRELADRIRLRVKEEIGITVSVGVSYNKVFAKLGSDLKKPDATTVITCENYQRLIWPLPVTAMLFVGHTAAEQLHKLGIRTIGEMAQADPATLEKMLGKGGPALWRYANGLEDAPVLHVGEREPAKSIGNGMTFRRDLVGWDELKSALIALADEVASRLRAEQVKCGVLQVTIKNPELKSICRQTLLPHPTHLQKELVEEGMRLLHANWREKAPVRALTLTAQQLIADKELQEQVDLTDGRAAVHDKFEQAEAAMQKLRRRYGRSSIVMGFSGDEELGLRRVRHQPVISDE